MTTIREIVETLSKSGHSPMQPNYQYHVEKLLNTKFDLVDKDLSRKNELLIKNLARRLTVKVKEFYRQNSRHLEHMLNKKKDWFSVVIENPLSDLNSTPKSKVKVGRPKKSKGGRPTKTYAESKQRQRLRVFSVIGF